MGLNCGAQVLYSVRGLKMGDIVDICHGLASEQGMVTPTIDVDCSNACFKVGKNVQSVVKHLVKWAGTGLCIVPVCDGTVRPICKQASNKRKADRDKNRIKASIIRKDLRSLNRRAYLDAPNRSELLTEIATLEKECRTAEAASSNVVSGTLDAELIVELEQTGAHLRNDARGFVHHVMTAEFQADSLIMGRVINGSTLMVQTSDSDIPAISSDDCIAIKDFTKEGQMQIVSTSEQTIKKAMTYLSEGSRNHVTFTPAKHPIFEGVVDRRLRALIAIFLGCDVCIKGLPGVGAKTMNEIINVYYPKYSKRCPNVSLFAYLKRYLCNKMKGYNHSVVQTYIRALIYEPMQTHTPCKHRSKVYPY